MNYMAMFVILLFFYLTGCFANSMNYSECHINNCIEFDYLNTTKERVDIRIRCSLHFKKDIFCDNVWSNVTVLSLVSVIWKDFFQFNFMSNDVDLHPNTFERFGHLEELYISNFSLLTLYPGSFRGLDNLRVLNLSNIVSLGYSNFMSAFDSDTLPSLQELILHMTGNEEDNFMLRDAFFLLLSSRPVRVLDLSDIITPESFGVSCVPRYSEFFNISGISDENTVNFILDYVHLNDTCGNTRIRKMVSSSHVEFRCLANVYFELKKSYFIRGLLWSAFLFVNVPCHKINLLDLSNNGFQRIYSRAFWMLAPLKQLLMSNNSIGEMVSSEPEQFQQLFSPLERLENLDLSRNKIATLLDGVFTSNRHLKRLNLSGNVLKQFSLNLSELTNLEYFDLSDNLLLELDSTCLAKLNSMSINTQMGFRGLTIQCSKCEHHNTVKWLLEHKERIFSNTSLTCVNSKADVDLISKTVEENVHYICYRNIYIRNYIIFTVLAFVCFCSIVVVAFIRMRRQRNVHRLHRRRQQTIIRLDNGNLQFAAFILYSSKDEEFMRNFVYANLEKNLHLKVDSDRELVGFGDKNFKIGHCILSEVIRCTKASAALVVVLSDNFCSSNFCLQEFDVAFRVGKPIILMLKGEVDISLAPVAIRDLFNTYVRVLWRIDDYGEYELMTSWENVCNSILELGGVLGD